MCKKKKPDIQNVETLDNVRAFLLIYFCQVEKVTAEISSSRSKGGSMTRNHAAKFEDDDLREDEYDAHGSGTESDGQQEEETKGDKVMRLQGKLTALQERKSQCGETYQK